MTIKTCSLVVVTFISLVGCSSSPYSHFGNPSLEQVLIEHANKVQSLPEEEAKAKIKKAEIKEAEEAEVKKQQLEKMYQEWVVLKPQLAKLLAAESQKKPTNTLSQAPNVATPQQKTESNSSSMQTESNSTPQKKTGNAIATNKQQKVKASYTVPAKYTIQIGASKTKRGAVSFWNERKSKHPNILGLFEPNIEAVTKAGKPIFRIKFGGFPAYKKAKKLCDTYKQLGGQCLIKKIKQQ